MEYKHCSRCDSTKPTSDFYKNRSNSSGLTSYCKKCWNEYQKAYARKPEVQERQRDRKRDYMSEYRKSHPHAWAQWYRLNRERRLELSRRHRAENPARYKNYKLTAAFGITLAEYEHMMVSQNGACAICKRKPEKKFLAVDHCHATDRIRGLLCDRCNRGIGFFGDDPKTLRRAARYLTT
jgi:hypothetical protein